MAQNVPRKQPSPSVSDLSHMLSRGRTPHQIVQVTPHIKENAENTSTVTLLSANSRSQMLAVCMVCFLVLQTWGHCASQGQAACPVRPSLTARLGGGPMEASRPCARFYLARSLIFTPPSGSDLVAHSSPGLGPLGSSSISWRHFVTRHLCRVLQLKTQALFE